MDIEKCPSCDSTDLEHRTCVEVLEVAGLGCVPVDVPAATCGACGFDFTGHEAEEARDIAVLNARQRVQAQSRTWRPADR